MRAVGLKDLKNRLSEYVRLAASGETILVTDREHVVAELVPPREGRAAGLNDARLAEAVRNGWLTPALGAIGGPIPRRPLADLDALLEELAADRADRSIYVDSSVVLAQLLAEDRYPDLGFWDTGPLVSSRLLEYEVWNRVNQRGLGSGLGEDVRLLLARLAFLELVPPVLARALEPFPTPVRTLDAIHLASIDFLRKMGQRPALATYDRRLGEGATALAIPVAEL